MTEQSKYDVAIIGGGIAGFSCAIQLANKGYSVAVFEKNKYPFHKVCGEYISMESWNYLISLGIPLDEMNLPLINQLVLTSPDGKSFSAKLPLGGFGLSRFALDFELMVKAKEKGITIIEDCKVDAVNYKDGFTISTRLGQFRSTICCAATGKHSNLDVKWKRKYLQDHNQKTDNYVAVKYHIKTEWPQHLIGLHNFENGYCGISKIEDEKHCLCYITRANDLKKCNNSVSQLEKEYLFKNPHLKDLFEQSEMNSGFPATISNIHFHKKTKFEDHVLMLGDAAGMISPLCGNGMSIALHTGKIAAQLIHRYFQKELTRVQIEKMYENEWKENFSRRLFAGRILQRFFGSNTMSNLFVSGFRLLPFLASPIVKMTHGKPF